MRKKWSLSTQLLSLGICVGLLIPLVGYFSELRAKEVSQINQSIRDLSTQNLQKSTILGEMIFKFRTIRIEVRSIPLRGMNKSQIETQIELTKKAVGEFQDSVKKFEAHIKTEKEKRIYGDLNHHFSDFLAFGVELITMSSTFDPQKLDQVSQLVQKVCPEKAARVELAIQQLISEQTDETVQLVAQSQAVEKRSSQAIVWGSAITFLFAVALSLFLGRRISRNLQQLVSELVTSAGKVAETSDEISESGQSLAGGVSSQASAIQQTVSAIDEISSMIEKNAENAQHSRGLVSTTLEETEAGKRMIDAMVQKLEDIQTGATDLIEAVESGNQKISKIVDMITEIEAKTKVINEIVFQTKLLSFNASVEAARAGEAGKGFAVVAEEVGGLAVMSGQASKEISELLSASVNQVKSIISETRKVLDEKAVKSRNLVNQGLELGIKCGESFSSILEGTQQVAQKSNEISEASKEQSAGVGEVTKAIHQMNQTTQNNSGVAESLKEAAGVLSQQSESLKSIVEQLVVSIRGGQVSELTIKENTSQSLDQTHTQVERMKAA